MSITNKNDIYYKKYVKYKMKYLNLLLSLKNNAKVEIDTENSNVNELDKTIKNIVKSKSDTDNENSNKTIMSIDSKKSIDENNYKNSQIEVPSSVNILNKFKSIKNKLNEEEYNKLLYELSNKFSKKNMFNTHNFDIDDIIYIKKLNRTEKNILKSINESELNMLKKYSCRIIKDKIFDLIENKTCKDDKILDVIWKNLVIIDEELNCELDKNQTNKFNEYLEKQPC